MNSETITPSKIDSQQEKRGAWYSGLVTQIRQLVLTRAAFLFATLMLANVFAYLYHMVIARMMTPADYGELVTLMSVSYVLDVILRSVQAWLTKTVADVREAGAGRVRAVFNLAMSVLVPLAVVVFTVQALASGWIADFLQLKDAFPVVLLAIYAALHFLVPIPRGILLGLERLQSSGATIVVEPIGRVVLGVILVWSGLKVNGAMGGYAAGSLLSFGLGLYLIRPILASSNGSGQAARYMEGLDRYAFIVLIANICLMLMASIDQIIVKRYFSPEIAGNYAVTFVLGRVIVMTAISLGITVFTRSTSMVGGDSRHSIVLVKGLLVMGGIAAISTIAALTIPSVIVHLIAGTQYLIAATYLGLVGIEMTLFGLVYIQSYYHLSIGNTKILPPLCIAAVLEIVLLVNFHTSIQQVLTWLIVVMGSLLICVSIMSIISLRGSKQSVTTIDSVNG